LTLLLVVLLGVAGCGGATEGSDAGDGDAGDGGLDECQRDNSQKGSTDPEWQLSPGGEAASGYICPRGDTDHYWFTVDQDRSIVSVSLKNNTSFSPVDLCYDLYRQGSNTRLGGQCDAEGMDGVTDLEGTFYLETAGTYFIEVHDQNDDEEDPRSLNAYQLSIGLVQDPDPYEPNDSADAAKDIGSQAGFLSYLGDQDWFRVQVNSANQMMILDLQAQDRTPVDLRYDVFMPDGVTPVNAGQVEDGQHQVAALHDVLALEAAGTYYVRVTDAYSDDADIEIGYTLSVSVRDNPDSRDRGPSNDSWQDATVLQSGQTINDGYLATRADEDWYVITSPGTSDTNPALIEVEIEFPGSSPIIPSVDLIVADPNTPCSPGDACDYLVWTCGGCDMNAQCLDAQCPSHSCDKSLGKCVAANDCYDGGSYHGCGIRSLIMQGPSFGVGGSSKHLKTVAPMYGERYYLRVADYGARHLDPDNAYRFTVTVIPEPDSHESPTPNGLYLPYITGDQEEQTRDWNKGLATEITCSDNGSEIVCGPITGYISFRGDQDWYVLKLEGHNYTVPSEDEADPASNGPKVDFNLLWDWNFSGSGMNLGYVVMRGGDEMGPELGSGSGTWGDGSGQCSYVCGEYQAPARLYLWVFTPDFKKYDYNNPYVLTIRAVRGVCPGNCSYCMSCPYMCPNSRNPDPQCI